MRRPPAGLLRAAALALSAVSLAYTGLWLHFSEPQLPKLSEQLGLPDDQLLEPPVRLGFPLRFAPDRGGVEVTRVEEGGPAERAGVREGDVIVSIEGRSLAESAAPLLAVYRAARPGDTVRLQIARAGLERPLEVRAVFAARPLGDRVIAPLRVVSQLTLALPLVLLAVALPILLLRVEDPHAWRVAALLVAIAGSPGVPAEFERLTVNGFAFAMAYRGVASAFIPFFFYLFFSAFPSRSPVDRRLPSLKWLLLGLAALFALGGLGVGRRGEPWLPAGVAAALGGTASQALWLAYDYGSIGLGLACFLATALTSPSRDTRRRIRVVVFGALAGLGPVVTLNLLADLGWWHAPMWLATLAYSLVFLFPLSFAYAVVKHRVLELPVLLKRSARYVLVKRGFEVLLLVVGAQASALFAVALNRLLAVSPAVATTAGVAFGFLLATAAAPAVRRTTRVIDRSFFREAYDARLILQELAEGIRSLSSREELAARLREQLERALRPTSAFVYLESEAGRLRSEDAGVPATLREIAPDAAALSGLARPRQVGGEPGDEAAALLGPLRPECLVPIVGREARLLGLVVLGPRLSEEPYSGDDERLLASVATQAGVTLENMALAARMAERLQAEQRAAHEMELARQVQARLLPAAGPAVPSLDYAGRCVQARAVGGDYFDYLDAGAGGLALVLADVSGKGFPAALLVASLHAGLRSQSLERDGLVEPLVTVNRLLYEATETNRYATLFLGRFDPGERRLEYVNCGHNPPLVLRRDGSLATLEPTAMVVGLVPDWTAETGATSLCPGDLIAIYSDGITEATDAAGEEFGVARLAETLRSGDGRPPSALLDRVFDEVRRFSSGAQADDQTLVIARVR